MNKQEQIGKMAKIIEPDVAAFGEDRTIATSLIRAGYVNGADFVEWLKEKYGDLFYEIVLRETGYPYREQVDLDKALQEYLKGE